jgi:hypothetical protein
MGGVLRRKSPELGFFYPRIRGVVEYQLFVAYILVVIFDYFGILMRRIINCFIGTGISESYKMALNRIKF